ncbi:MAG: hypothetical protein ACAF41_12030 [Leptolyngbya sp. BL-A-14]
MKKYAFLAVVALLAVPGIALSEMGSGAPNGDGMMNQERPSGRQGGDPAQFQTRKAEILKRLSARITELQQRQSCVQAANDRQALMTCMPQKKGQQGQQGQQRPQGEQGPQGQQGQY